ncbi:MAG: ATP-binding protein [Candidatus Treponema excrementipullorum]|uniref:ATP-binding protein n=1 Tax=Candidatus Treponema excrementipullorum TaxID=2838768 RepID=A0A9E2L110_9SPIR|nr:ATP-binding protein [Candidatus Treponema excrementipullorum]MCI6480688.1 ATP-binding protein [Spirochaetia bacterium]MCI6954272.1 ATP-binding protein [Spirochaetia bacterium]MCI7589067.1 ATP-binding protein [Spirochaetia bacterium]MDD7012233.1 ATP-binding protein [Candidatus Treponema excrementipullorum]
MEQIKELRVDENDALFDKTNMLYKEFPSDFRQIRYFTLLIVQSAPLEIKEINLLEQQISEVIKNAVKHGNKCDINKKVSVWYSFSPTHAHLIVEDEGEGFKDLEKWNEFNRKRLNCLHDQNYEDLANYVSFRTLDSDDQDGGNALFAALEYWNGGFVFNEKRNGVAMLKKFQQKRIGIVTEGE